MAQQLQNVVWSAEPPNTQESQLGQTNVTGLDMAAINADMTFHPNASYTISAGAITFDRAAQTVLLIYNTRLSIWQLPKGRKHLDEDISVTALRETYEETGYRVRLLPLRTRTRATRADKGGTKKSGSGGGGVETVDDSSTEPVGMVTYADPQTTSETEVRKMCFFYVGVVEDEARGPDSETQEAHEKLEARWVGVDEAQRMLEFEAEAKALACAWEGVKRSYYGVGVDGSAALE